MKLKLASALIILAISALSHASDCPNERLYQKAGWVVHNPSEFEVIHKNIIERINTGLKTKTLGNDVYAIYNFDYSTSDKKDFIAEMNSWDDFQTGKDEMWGDIALYTNFDRNSVPVEIHWYENGGRHIVINPLEVQCINMPPTGTINSVY